MLPALAGANVIYGMGMLESGLTWDYASLIMQDDFVSYLMHILRGAPINDNTLNVDLINEVGPGGEFLSHENTFYNMNKLSKVKLMDRGGRENWEAMGSKDIAEKAYEKAIHIIENHNSTELSEDIQKQLAAISEETAEIIKEKKLRNK